LSKDAGKLVAALPAPTSKVFSQRWDQGRQLDQKEHRKTIMSCDIGGGTSNFAISRNGEVLSTSCIAVGGRLLAMDSEIRIRQLADPAVRVMKEIGLDYRLGDSIPKPDIEKIATKLAEVLIEVMTGPARSSLARDLMMTPDLDFSIPIDEYMFSGGVAEIIYAGKGRYNDIGSILAKKIRFLTPKLGAPVVEPVNKIRATVIGAGAYSLSVSGSSGFMDDKLTLPIRNIPVLRVDAEYAKLSLEHVVSKVNMAFQRHDLVEGQEIVALYFRDPVRVNYPHWSYLRSPWKSPSQLNRQKMPVILILKRTSRAVWVMSFRRETGLKTNLLSLDELCLSDGIGST
jgi:ethanolamine utilization protein EutA